MIRIQQNHPNLNLQKIRSKLRMKENHQVIHLNSKKRSRSPHFKQHNSSMRNSNSTSEINFNRIADTPSPIFGLNEFNDSHRYSKGRIQSIRSPSNRSGVNTNRSYNNNQPIMYNSALLKSQQSNSLRVDTLEGQENRSFLRKEFQNQNSITASELSQLTRSQNLRQYPTQSMKTPQKMHRKGTSRQSSKSPQKLNLIKNIVNVSDLNSIRNSQNNSHILININDQQNRTKASFGTQNYTKNNLKSTKFPTVAATTLRNQRSNVVLVPSNQINRLQMSNSSQRGFLKNQSSQENFLTNSEGQKVNVSSYIQYRSPQNSARNTTPQRIPVHMNPKSNITITLPQTIVRNVSSSPIYKNMDSKLAENSRIVPVQTPENGQYIVSSISDREKQLLRKVKVLQNRIGELHNQKQNAVLKLRQENHRLISQSQQLKDQIEKLRTQIQRLVDKDKHYELSSQLYERQVSSDRVQEKISQLDPRQSQANLTTINGAIRQSSHSRDNNFLVEDYENKIQQLIVTLQTQKTINNDLKEQIKQLKQFSCSKISQPHIQKEGAKIIHLGKIRNNSNSAQGGSTKRELQNLKRTVIEESKYIQMNNQMIIDQYEMQVSNLKGKIAQLQTYRAKKLSQLENSRNVRNSETNYSNLENSREDMQRNKPSSQLSERNSKQIYPAGTNSGRQPQDDYTQIEQLNQVIDKITNLEERNCQMETLVTNLKIESDSLKQKNRTLEDRVKELQTEKENIQEALNNTTYNNAQTIRILNQQKEQYSVILKNYVDELNQLRFLCEKYSQKALSLSSSGVQTEINPKLNNNSYGGSNCKKCQDLMKTVSKLNSHLNPRR